MSCPKRSEPDPQRSGSFSFVSIHGAEREARVVHMGFCSMVRSYIASSLFLSNTISWRLWPTMS
jgi:hypothetical protein